MARVLLLGYDPETVDYTDPALPPGLTSEKIHAGIAAGVRLPPRSLATFEAVVNAVHKHAPGATIAFNTRPDDSAQAAGAMAAGRVVITQDCAKNTTLGVFEPKAGLRRREYQRFIKTTPETKPRARIRVVDEAGTVFT